MKNYQLLSEHEQSPKSAQNYKDCFQKLLQECPPLGNYLEKNLIPWPADWPGWYYPKKKPCSGECNYLRQSVIPEQGQFYVAFIPMGQHILLLDSHCHTQSGAYGTLQWLQAVGFGNSWSGTMHSTAFHIAWEQ